VGRAWTVFTAQQPGTHQLYECEGSTGRNNISADPQCNGLFVGKSFFVYDAAGPGRLPLIRCNPPYNGPTGEAYLDSTGCGGGYGSAGIIGYADPPPTPAKCAVGSDCADCGLRRGLVACVPQANAATDPKAEQSTCPMGFFCEPNSKACHLKLTPLKAMIIDKIPAGQKTDLADVFELPPNWGRDPILGAQAGHQEFNLVVLARPERLYKDATGNFQHDPSQPAPAPGQLPIEMSAAAFSAGAFVTDLAPKCQLKLVDATLAASSFSLSDDVASPAPVMTLTVRYQARGRALPQGSVVNLTGALKLPGHAIPLPDKYVPGSTPLPYDANRQINLWTDDPYTKQRVSLKGPVGILRGSGAPTDLDDQQVTTATVPLYLSRADAKALSETLNQAAGNPGLKNNQLPGSVHLTLNILGDAATQSTDVDVVFVPPAASAPATDQNPVEPPTGAGDQKLAKDYPGGNYPIVDYIVPPLYRRFGNDFIGADMQVLEVTSQELLSDVLIKKDAKIDDFLRVGIGPAWLTLLRIAGEVDFGTQRPLQTDIANLTVVVPPTNVQQLVDAVQGNNTFIKVAYDFASNCTTVGGQTSCAFQKFGGENPEDKVNYFGIDFNVAEEETTVQLPSLELPLMEKCYGPAEALCVTLKVEITSALGIEGALGFWQQTTPDANGKDVEYFTGMEATVGPYAVVKAEPSLAAKAFIFEAAAGGEVQLIKASVVPQLRLGVDQKYKKDAGCWWMNNGSMTLEGNLVLEGAEGKAALKITAGGTNLVSVDLANWPKKWEETRPLFGWRKSYRGSASICPDAPLPSSTFKSPIGCKTYTGADGYCANSMSFDQVNAFLDGDPAAPSYPSGKFFRRFFTGQRQGGKLVVNGSLERYPAAGWTWGSGGDVLLVNAGPAKSAVSIYGVPQPSDSSACGWANGLSDTFPFGSSTTGGTVSCGPYANSGGLNVLAQAARSGYFSGDFKDFGISFANDSQLQETMRWVDVALATDSTSSREGVSVRFEPLDAQESVIQSDSTWWSSVETQALKNDLKNSWAALEFYLDPFVRPSFMALHFNDPPYKLLLPAAPFTYKDVYQSGWIWPTGVVSDNQVAYFRRPFFAAGNKYAIHFLCDNYCEVYLDGNLVGKNALQLGATVATMTTRKGQLHMLSVRALNGVGNGGPDYAAINVTAKVVP
jgi:hypothetical protein